MIRVLLMALALSGLSCASLPKPELPEVSPDSALKAAQDTCRVYDALPAEYRNERDDKACHVVKRICLVPAEPPVELKADPPAMGNKIVDAGADGAGGSEN